MSPGSLQPFLPFIFIYTPATPFSSTSPSSSSSPSVNFLPCHRSLFALPSSSSFIVAVNLLSVVVPSASASLLSESSSSFSSSHVSSSSISLSPPPHFPFPIFLLMHRPPSASAIHQRLPFLSLSLSNRSSSALSSPPSVTLPSSSPQSSSSLYLLIKLIDIDGRIIGGPMLHDGCIAEMKKGEGKTLVSTLAAYLNALIGNGVHDNAFISS
ncbi:hypothetical protein ACLOJK_012594 [Asimina triloba]